LSIAFLLLFLVILIKFHRRNCHGSILNRLTKFRGSDRKDISEKKSINEEKVEDMFETIANIKIDTLDIRIIQELKRDGLASAAEIGRILGANERTIRRRIKELVDKKIIQYTVIVNAKAFGYTTATDIFLSLDPEHEEDVIAILLDTPEVFYVARGQGNDSVSIQARFKDTESMFTYLYKTLPNIPGVTVKGFALIPRIIKTTDSWVPGDHEGSQAL